MMADSEVATRAPESDANEGAPATDNSATDTGSAETTVSLMKNISASTASPIPGDTPAQAGPSMGEHCTTDQPTPASAPAPAGEFTALNNIDCYISKPSDYPHSPGKLLLLLTGGTGIKSTNNQLQADAFAERGFIVVMPDQFGGDTAPNIGKLSDYEAQQKAQAESSSSSSVMPPSLLERIKMGAAEAAKSFLIDMWLARHTPEKVLPIVRAALEGAKEAYADAVANGGGVYGAGYCFGAKYILILCGAQKAADSSTETDKADAEKAATAPQPELKVGSIAHGTLVTKEDIEAVRSPVSMACVEGDNLFPDNVREQGRASLELNAVEHEVRVFDDVPHGFAVLHSYTEERIKERQGEAFEMMAAWLESH